MIGCLAGAVYGHWAMTWEEKMLWLCAGALIGGFLQMVVPAGALMREGWRPRFDLSMSEPLRQIFRLMAPTVFGSAIYLINMAVSRVIGLSLNESAVTVLTLATRLMELPIGVFAIAVSTVVFPLIAKFAAEGDWANMAASYRQGMRLILVINVPAAVGLMVLATPIIRVLFQRGAFRELDVEMMRPVLIVFALGLPFVSFVTIVLRAFYAQKDTATPVRAALLSFAVNAILSVFLMQPLGTLGLALASNVAIVVQAVFLQSRLARKREGFEFRPVLGELVKVTVAAIVMGALVAGGWWAWLRFVPLSKLTHVVGLVVLVGFGAGVYAAAAWGLKIEGRHEVAAMFGRVREKLA
jgi:putative peptidoglycan lipid II flippase